MKLCIRFDFATEYEILFTRLHRFYALERITFLCGARKRCTRNEINVISLRCDVYSRIGYRHHLHLVILHRTHHGLLAKHFYRETLADDVRTGQCFGLKLHCLGFRIFFFVARNRYTCICREQQCRSESGQLELDLHNRSIYHELPSAKLHEVYCNDNPYLL